MKHSLIFAAVLSAGLCLHAADDKSITSTSKGKLSYSLGMDIGRNITNQSLDIDVEALTAGLKAVASGGKPLLNDQEYQEAMTQFRTEMAAKRAERSKQMQEKQKEMAEKNKKDGETFLAENKKKAGVVTLPSGLQYKVITAGTGKKPAATDKVVTHYRGTLVDGTEFDSSYRRGETVSFPVTGVIKGWQEALQLMPVGSKWQLFIPPDIAYGDAARPKIPGGSVLLFDLELISIDDGTGAAKPK